MDGACWLTWNIEPAGSPMPAAYRTAVTKAVTAWQAAGYRFTRVSDGADITIRFGPVDGNHAAWSSTEHGVILINPANNYRFGFQRRALMAHEVGHMLGLPHTTRVGSVMNPDAMGLRPDARDLADARALIHLTGETRCPTA